MTATYPRRNFSIIFEIVDIDTLSQHGPHTVSAYLTKPPEIDGCLKVLAQADDTLRFGIVMSVVDVALTDGSVSIVEHELIQTTCKELNVSQDQLKAITGVDRKAHEVAEAEGKDPAAIEALETTVKGLGAFGVPITAVYFSERLLA